jgi:hypothetical protein
MDTALELAGIACLVVAAFLVALPLGLVVLGCGLLVVGVNLELRRKAPEASED